MYNVLGCEIPERSPEVLFDGKFPQIVLNKHLNKHPALTLYNISWLCWHGITHCTYTVRARRRTTNKSFVEAKHKQMAPLGATTSIKVHDQRDINLDFLLAYFL